MGSIDRAKKQMVSHLREGEVVQAAFLARIPKRDEQWVISTNQLIYVFEATSFRRNLGNLIGSLPRSTKFGTPHGIAYRLPVPELQRRYVPRFCFAEVEASDRSIGVSQ
jgi:hypothetical protein